MDIIRSYKRIRKMVRNISNIRLEKTDALQDVSFCFVFHSLCSPKTFQTFVYTPYKNPDRKIESSKWLVNELIFHSINSTEQHTIKGIMDLFDSGIWELCMIARVYPSDSRLPIQYISYIHPVVIMRSIGMAHLNDICGMYLYHYKNDAKRLTKCYRLSHFIRSLPKLFHAKKQKRINQELSLAPPGSFTSSFSGGSTYDASRSAFYRSVASVDEVTKASNDL